MQFSYSAIWDDTIRLTRQHLPLLVAIAGVFIFLPSLILAVMLPPPEPSGVSADRMLQTLIDHWQRVAPWYVLGTLVTMIGTAAMLKLVFSRDVTVAAALAFGLALLPFLFLLQVLVSVILLIGFILLIIPCLYLVGRLAPAVALMVAENRRNPIETISRSFAITKGRGWAVFGLVFIVGIVGGISVGVVNALLGIVFHLTASNELATLLMAVVSCALSAAFATLIVMLYAAIYRALTESDSVAAAFE